MIMFSFLTLCLRRIHLLDFNLVNPRSIKMMMLCVGLLIIIRGNQAAWPLSNDAQIQLLGLFQDNTMFAGFEMQSSQFLALFKAAIVLSQRYNITINGQFLGWRIEQTNGKNIDTLKSTCSAISSSNIVGIVGPRMSGEAHVIAAFAGNIGIPVVSYIATDSDLSSKSAYPAFYRTIPSDMAAVLAIVQLFKRYQWTSCVIIYQNDAYGYSGMRMISEAFLKNNFKVKEMIKFDMATGTISSDFKHYLTNSGTRIVVVWAVPMSTLAIIQHALDHDLLGPYFLWILSSSLPLHSFNQTYSHKLAGMLTVEPATGGIFHAPINTSLLSAAYEVWKEYEGDTFPGEKNVDQYALFAFDATWLLIQSLQRLCSTGTEEMTRLSCISWTNSPFCFDRQLISASSFFDQITSTKFIGVTGPIEYTTNGTDRSNGIYYFAQNAQLSSEGVHFVPVLKYSESKSWEMHDESNIIVWPNQSCMKPSDHVVLSGVTLRIGIIILEPFAKVEQTETIPGWNQTKFIGYTLDLIELLQEKMNFVPHIISTPRYVPYIERLYAVANGTYDILIGDVTVTAERREIASFSASIFDTSFSTVIRKPVSLDVDLFSYMRPFSSKLWGIILLAILYASFLIYLLEKSHNTVLRNRSLTAAGAMSIWYSIGTIMGYGVDFQATTASGRLVTAAMYMLSLLLVATYTANLASILTKATPRYIIAGIDDIKRGKLSPHRFGVLNGTAMEQYYLREISHGVRNYHMPRTRTQLLTDLLAGTIDATILDSNVAEYLTNNVYCNLTAVGHSFGDNVFGIVIPKDWPYQRELDVNILSLRESGKLDALRRKWFLTGKCDSIGEISSALQLESMAGLFLIFGIITALAILPIIYKKCFIIKNYFCRLKTRIHVVAQAKDSTTKNSNQTS